MTQQPQIWDKAVQRSSQWLQELANELSWTDLGDTLVALRSVLHALRDRLPINEAAQLAAHLPLLIKGIYYDGWHPSKTPVKARTKEDFLALVKTPLERGVAQADAEQVTRAVFRLLAGHVSAGEISDIRGIFPRELADLWPARATV